MDFALDLPDSRLKRVPLSPKKENIIHFSTPESKVNSNQSSNKSLKDTAKLVPRLVTVFPGCKDRLESTVSLLTKYKNLDHFAYERKDVWHIGLGSRSSLQVDSRGKIALKTEQGRQEECHIVGSLTDFVRDFVEDQSRRHEGKIFGQVGFNYGAHVREQSYTPGRWPILSIMVPELEITLRPEGATIQGYDQQQLNEVSDFLKSTSLTPFRVREPQPVNTHVNGKEYKTIVSKALAEITDGKYNKVIISRAVDLGNLVDMPSTLLHGRRGNTPARSYIMSHAGFQVTGFSPELVMAVQNGLVVTEPLAGTCSRTVPKEEYAEMLTHKLLSDPKEIVEHIISVKEAISELNRFCVLDTVSVKDLMSIKERGSVEHLGSSVYGHLSPNADPWTAFNVLFPSITASGIPKDLGLQAINHLETRPRELYSGAVLLIDLKEDFFEATLCLRIVLQDPTNTWIQAGAGIIAQSNPDREFTETNEKMASVAPYIVFEGKGGKKAYA